jgi:hypothetical protein
MEDVRAMTNDDAEYLWLEEVEHSANCLSILVHEVNPYIDKVAAFDLLYEILATEGLHQVNSKELGRAIRATMQPISGVH